MYWRNALLILALVLLGFGLYAPMITVEKFYFFRNTVSLLSALQQLAAMQEWGLFMLIALFSVIFPLGKLLLLILLNNISLHNTPRQKKAMYWLAHYSKWSMLDVFVVALLVVTVKLDALAQARVEVGIYAFAGSVLLTTWLTYWIGRHKTD